MVMGGEPRTLSLAGGIRAGDIYIKDDTANFQSVWDLTLTDSTSAYNISERSFDSRFAATARAERAKMDKYLDTEWYQQGIFMPIAISATGMLGEMAVAALNALKVQYELPDSFLSQISKDIGIICSKYWAKINITGRINMRYYSIVNAVMDVGVDMVVEV
jgi:hypothetical protein